MTVITYFRGTVIKHITISTQLFTEKKRKEEKQTNA